MEVKAITMSDIRRRLITPQVQDYIDHQHLHKVTTHLDQTIEVTSIATIEPTIRDLIAITRDKQPNTTTEMAEEATPMVRGLVIIGPVTQDQTGHIMRKERPIDNSTIIPIDTITTEHRDHIADRAHRATTIIRDTTLTIGKDRVEEILSTPSRRVAHPNVKSM